MATEITGTFGKYTYSLDIEDLKVSDIRSAVEEAAEERIKFLASEGYVSGEFIMSYTSPEGEEYELCGWIE